jgi:hypothetical protein
VKRLISSEVVGSIHLIHIKNSEKDQSN